MSDSQPTAACCTNPPVVSEGYTPKGEYKPYAGLDKAYVTGSANSELGIVFIYDIFGYFPQTVQAADLLASLAGARVILPDILRNEFLSTGAFPTDTQEKKDVVAKFFGGIGAWGERAPEVQTVAKQLKDEGAKSVIVGGLCWGVKVALLAATNKDINGVWGIHPSFTNVPDANDVNVPCALFPSGQDPIEQIEEQYKIISTKPTGGKSLFKAYRDMIHGFAGARADLSNVDNVAAYTEAYGAVANFAKGIHNTPRSSL